MKRALVIAVNAYGSGDGAKGNGAASANYLRGSVLSGGKLAAALSAKGVAVTSLFNAAATHTAILATLRSLYAHAKPGDLVVVSYHGHGTQAEVGGTLQDALVPVDCLPVDGSWRMENLIPASAWQHLLEQRPPGVRVLTNLDCCYGGGLIVPAKVTPAVMPAPITPRTRLTPGPVSAGLAEFAACRAGELSYQVQVGGQWWCAWTYALVQALLHASPAASYAGVFSVASTTFGKTFPSLPDRPTIGGDSVMLRAPFLT